MHHRKNVFAWFFSFALVCVTASTAIGQSLDDQLFEDLKDPVPTLPEKEDVSEKQFNQQLQRELGGEDVGMRRQNPLSATADAMRQVRERLVAKDTAAETREMQKSIVGNLDRLIEQLKKQQNKQPKGGGDPSSNNKPGDRPKPSRPQQSQNPRQNQGGQSKQSAKQAGTKLGSPVDAPSGGATRDRLMQESWGSLPANVRQQMQSARPEKFLPKYAQLIEEYFQRLSEEEK